MCLYSLAHTLKDKLPFIWDAIENVNEMIFALRYGKNVKNVAVTCVPDGYKLVALKDVDTTLLVKFFVHQPDEAFTFFKPHGFDSKSIERLQKNKSFLAYLLIDKANGQIAGYCFNRCFFHGKGFRGRMVNIDYRGKGLGTAMNKILNEVGFGIGLRLFESVSKDNVASYRSALSASNVKVVQELPHNELYLEILPELMNQYINQKAFLALLRVGLWGSGYPDIQIDGTTDWQEVYRLATEQSVLGLVLAGLEHSNVKPPQAMLLQWIGEVQLIEQRNKSMNIFITDLIEKLRRADIYALLVKGQGVAQCYVKPLWRCSGDVDLLLSNDNYQKAKSALIPIASEVANEEETTMHQALVMNGFDVELHGRMPFLLSKRVDDGIDEVLGDLFFHGNVRSWDCNGTQVFLPSFDNDVILVFTHFLHHFFIEGVGLRQICDWCRLLYFYKDSLNYKLLESRIRKMGLMSEWKAFGALAVNMLGMPIEAMPFYDERFKNKAEKVLGRVLKSGNFGHNKDLSYRVRYKGFTYKLVAAWRRLWDFASLISIFPLDAPRFYVTYVLGKVK